MRPPVLALGAIAALLASSSPAADAPQHPFHDALDAAEEAIGSGDWAKADQQITAASALAGDDAHRGFIVARMRATRFVYTNDFERAGAALLAVMPLLAKHPELQDEFWAHNTMMMIREAQGEVNAALAENDRATACAARGTWESKEDRETLAFQKDRWHRAYLSRMLAESRTGAAKQKLIDAAQTALADYRTRGFPDSIAVLESYFAALDGKKEDALAAAKRVDPAEDDDLEDLYLVAVGLEAGGDHAAAESVRRAMRESTGVRISRAIMLRWLELDAKGARAFTPWHAATYSK